MIRIHLILSTLIILSQQCTNLQDNKLFITSTPGETITIPLYQIFYSNDYDQTIFQPVVPQFTIQAPLQEQEKIPINGLKGEKISIKILKSTKSSEPQHLMAILLLNEGTYYSEYDLKYYSTFPNLQALFQSTGRANSICYDIALLSTLVITECSDDEGDYFSILKIDQSPHTYLPIEKPKDSFRKLDMIDQYLLRGTVDKLELYQEQGETLIFLNSLDSAAMKTLLKQVSFDLQIRDFQTHTNGQISILNASGELIALQYKDNKWQLIRKIDTQIPDVYSYDLDVYKNSYVILSKTQLFHKTITTQEFTIAIDSKQSDKVYLQKNSIVVLQEKTIILYSEQLYRFQSQILGDSQYKINSHPNSDGFLVVDEQNFYRYVISNDYSLQFSSGSLPIETEYKMTQLIQKNSCIIDVYYMVVGFESTQIYSTQVPQALIAGSVYQDNLDVKLSSIYQGSNLKYEFSDNEILNLKVEQFQTIEVFGVGDASDVIYRKALSNLNNPYIQIIQQHSNKQISGFTCEILSFLRLNCQSIFSKRQFETLQDSDKQLWWFNYNSIFLAILKDSTVTIYCVYYNQNRFDVLTTINFDSNPISIATDGFYLFVQLQQSVKIYKVSTENKATLFSTQDIVGRIYASPAQEDILYIEQDKQLNVYSLQYEKFTLIWFTEVNDNYDQMNFIIFKNYFARVIKTKDEEKYNINVFNCQNINNIYLEKIIKINDYSNLVLSQIQVNFQKNLFYILGQKAEQQKLLIYKVNENSLNTMFLSIDVVPAAQFTITHSYCFITNTIANKQVQQNYFISGDNLVQSKLKENYQQVEYSKEITLKVSIKNDAQIVVTQQIPALIVNRGVSIFQTKSSLNLTYKADGAKNHCIDLDQSWYSGQAFDITQTESSQKIKYEKTLSKQSETFEFSPYIQELNSDTIVQLMEQKIVLIKKSDLSKVELTLDKTYLVNKLLLIQDQHIYVEVYKEALIYLKVIECKDSNCKYLDDELQFENNINKVFLHQTNYFIYSNAIISVYDTKGDPTKLSGFEKFNQFILSKQPYLVEFQHLRDDIYTAISVDVRGNVYFNNIEISRTSSDQLEIPTDVLNTLKKNQLYVTSNAVCVGMVVRKNEIVIVYNNIATYSFKYEFDCYSFKLCELKYFTLSGVYQQYGGWFMFNLYPIIYQNENILSMVYWAYNRFELLLFDLESSSSKQNPKLAIAHLNGPTSAIPGHFYQFQSFVYSFNGQLQLLATTDQEIKLQHYTLKRSQQICTSAQQANEIIKLTLQNSIYNEKLTLNVTISQDNQIPPEPEPTKDDDTKGFPIWAIILIIIGVLLIGLIVFNCWKNKKNKVDDQRILLA
ncbi:unnamed protein product (macronuclear) [Paramecium tetraurelia]|uniref:Transmembrane protein n=1 Tax=Paramecium tetraurelia TaxID=5888 RepID=A0E240_PARTE|nr:uncharacterized protein GSPATT00022529001 [Paramecium tetraurelia]CAK89357.1 unnamed protein product [Paramecium tetraurelia]|eukprot:XP_001456754.1 hypothetical protein (macronuclear) [Paramecium tetraurelia strain d4-2]